MRASDSTVELASSQRPLPLVARSDLTCRIASYRGQALKILKDPISLQYFQLQPQQHAIWELLDGRRSLEAIHTAFSEQFPDRRLTIPQIWKLIIDLHQQGLLWSQRAGQGEVMAARASELRKRRWIHTARNFLFIRLPGWDPHRLLNFGYPLLRWILHPSIVCLGMVSCVLTWAFVLVQFDELRRRIGHLDEFASWQLLLCMWAALGVAKLLHELGHGFACRHFGGECHEIGLAFLVFSPCFYCDVSDAWLLASRRKRMAVSAAGMYVESLLSVAALWIWWHSREGLLHHMCLSLFLVTSIGTVLFNLNPLLRLDGYYLLSDWLEIPNLRRKADQLMRAWMARMCLGISLPADPLAPTDGRCWFILYALASTVYRWLLVIIISVVLYKMLQPYGFEELGMLLGGISVLAALAQILRQLRRLTRTHRDQLVASRRPAITLGVVLAGGFAALLLPFPIYLRAPLIVEPQGLQHLYVTTPGTLLETCVVPGQRVRRGDVLVLLANAGREDRLRALETALAIQELEVGVHRAIGDARQEALAAESLQAIRREWTDYQRQIARLSIVAPCDGVVIAPPAQRERPSSRREVSLPHWHDTPLAKENRGSFLQAATHLLSIAPHDSYRAVLLIDAFDRHGFGVGQEVQVRVDAQPRRTFRGVISTFGARAAELAETTDHLLKQKRATTATGLRAQQTPYYQATVLMPAQARQLLPGMRGQARILTTQQTLASWAWRHFRATFTCF